METIAWDDFERVDLRVGTIVSAEVFKDCLLYTSPSPRDS